MLRFFFVILGIQRDEDILDGDRDHADWCLPHCDRARSNHSQVCALHQVHHRQVCDESRPPVLLLQVT